MMKAWLKDKFYNTDRGSRALFPLWRAREWLHGGWRSDHAVMERTFLQTFGYPLDWENPRTLNEKMNWMKRYYRNPLQTLVSDKVAVRGYVSERLGEDILVPLIRTYDRADDFRLADMPEKFALKVNHGSGQNWLVTDKSAEDEQLIIREFWKWMKLSHYATAREWPYKDIRPQMIAEHLLLDENGAIPMDFKFHCFGGKAETIQVDLDRQIRHCRNFYDLDWNLEPFIWTEWDGDVPKWPNGRAVERPKTLARMIEISEILAEGFPYIRIDLYEAGERIYFGEMTFYHGGGFERFDPHEVDLRLGGLVELPPL